MINESRIFLLFAFQISVNTKITIEGRDAFVWAYRDIFTASYFCIYTKACGRQFNPINSTLKHTLSIHQQWVTNAYEDTLPLRLKQNLNPTQRNTLLFSFVFKDPHRNCLDAFNKSCKAYKDIRLAFAGQDVPSEALMIFWISMKPVLNCM